MGCLLFIFLALSCDSPWQPFIAPDPIYIIPTIQNVRPSFFLYVRRGRPARLPHSPPTLLFNTVVVVKFVTRACAASHNIFQNQVVACIELSIEHESKISDAVVGWYKQLGAEKENNGVDLSGLLGSASASASLLATVAAATARAGEEEGASRATVVTEREFHALKCAEARQALETDTLAVLVLHAFYLVLPCQPFKFHFLWGRFMSFYNDNNLYP